MKPCVFSVLMSNAFQGWNTLSVEYMPSMMSLCSTIFSSRTSMDNTEKKLHVQMRQEMIANILNKMPHPCALQLLLYLLDLIGKSFFIF